MQLAVEFRQPFGGADVGPASGVQLAALQPPPHDSWISYNALQLLSYYMSVARGYDPDFPRNLSKTLTVD